MKLAGLCLIALVSLPAAAVAAGNAAAGADVFDSSCSECHSVSSKIKNKKGPSLFGIWGRNTAAIAGFDYSSAIKSAGFVWSADKLDAYVTAPKKVIPDGKMKFDGLSSAQERLDLLAFLAEQK